MRRGIKLDIFLITFNKLHDFKFFSKILVKKTSEMMTRKKRFFKDNYLLSRKRNQILCIFDEGLNSWFKMSIYFKQTSKHGITSDKFTMWYIEHADSKDFQPKRKFKYVYKRIQNQNKQHYHNRSDFANGNTQKFVCLNKF